MPTQINPPVEAPVTDSELVRVRGRLAYRALTGLVAVLAYALVWVGFALWLFAHVGPALLEASSGILLGGSLALLALAAAVIPLRWLHAPLPQPLGVAIAPSDAYKFHLRVARLCARLGVAPVDDLRITPEMNAAVVCRPRYGLVGPMRATLLIGLPLVYSLSPRQLCAVLAHELAHLRCHGAYWGRWGVHLHGWWLRVQCRIDEDRTWLGRLAKPMVARAARRDVRDWLQLSRLEEFAADALAARTVGTRALASALMELAMKDRFLNEDYWAKIMSQAERQHRPSIRPFRDMGIGMLAGFHRGQAAVGMARLLAESAETSDDDTHPSLLDRLEALGVRPSAGRRERASAAQHYFLPLLPRLAGVFDRLWWEFEKTDWRLRYYSARRLRRHPPASDQND